MQTHIYIYRERENVEMKMEGSGGGEDVEGGEVKREGELFGNLSGV